MRIEAIFLLGVGIFFGAIALIYWFISYEDGGFLMLIGSCTLGLLPGGYYLYWHQRFRGRKFFFWGTLDKAVGDRPEDRSDATIGEGAGVINSFPGSSIWPFTLGMGAFVILLGLVFGVWLLLPGVGLLLTALIGVTAESRRGGHV
ncbi:MAG TPA: cytochrome c oxidase subunit 4 [Acidimicrobiales bacterium]|nr:cytochrome c oxidase subunit 4 [Acidimicrobiales bacterium]